MKNMTRRISKRGLKISRLCRSLEGMALEPVKIIREAAALKKKKKYGQLGRYVPKPGPEVTEGMDEGSTGGSSEGSSAWSRCLRSPERASCDEVIVSMDCFIPYTLPYPYPDRSLSSSP